MQQLKIALFTFSALPVIGGYQVFAYNLAQELAKRGHQVDYYMPRRYVRMLKATALEPSFNIRSLLWAEGRCFRWFRSLLSWRLRQLQRLHRYDLWQVVGAYPAGYLATTLVPTVPVVLRCHGEDIQKSEELDYGVRLDPLIEERIRRTLKSMNRIVALTPSVSSCCHELGVSSGKITEIPNAIAPERFDIPSGGNIRDELGMKPEDHLFLTVGRYHRKKGYEFIPEAARLLKLQGVRFRWLIVGNGLEAISELIRLSEVEQYVICREKIGVASSVLDGVKVAVPDEALIQLYRQADIFVMPSLMETFGMVLVEAMAAGVPVVSTTAPGCRDVVQDGVTGLLVMPGNSEELAGAIIKLCESKELRSSLVSTAKSQIGRFAWDTVVRQYEELYSEVLGL